MSTPRTEPRIDVLPRLKVMMNVCGSTVTLIRQFFIHKCHALWENECLGFFSFFALLETIERDTWRESEVSESDDREGMEEKKSGVGPKKEGVDGTGESYAWGVKLADSKYKSVNIRGQVFALGDCVLCSLDSKQGHYFGKIMRLSQVEDRKMCKIRRFFSASEFSPTVKGLDYIPNPKELFLASGEGAIAEEETILEGIARRCTILCIAEDEFNEMPSSEQIAAADHFFRRGYDLASEEVVGLDNLVETIGAQKVYNRKSWLVSQNAGRSSSQVQQARGGPKSICFPLSSKRRRVCVVCDRGRVQSFCSPCDTALCWGECWVKFHTDPRRMQYYRLHRR